MRRDKAIGSSLQAEAILSTEAQAVLDDAALWADICITSAAGFGENDTAIAAQGQKCERCWKVLPEVGESAKHPTLCRRCCEAVG